jgi:hypothetical protein
MPNMLKGRKIHFNPTTVYTRFGRRLSAALRGALCHLPAFLLLACTPLAQPETTPAVRKTQIYILLVGKTNLQGIDLLFFQDAPLYRLDAYQHLDGAPKNRVTGTSSTAARQVVILSNYPSSTYAWSGIRSIESLESLPSVWPRKPVRANALRDFGGRKDGTGNPSSDALPDHPPVHRLRVQRAAVRGRKSCRMSAPTSPMPRRNAGPSRRMIHPPAGSTPAVWTRRPPRRFPTRRPSSGPWRRPWADASTRTRISTVIRTPRTGRNSEVPSPGW